MFIYKEWDMFCQNLKEKGFISVPATTVLNHRNYQNSLNERFIILKHDVETNLKKALLFAQIENKYSHKGSYYVQAYLLHNSKNIEILKQIQDLGHEVTYHHDVMDSNKGNIEKAAVEFQKNVERFENNGFIIQTVCQHGNPVIERVGYSSNRDFFRNKKITKRYAHITEMMVNFKSRISEDYSYISDVGYGWKIIFDPENNDVVKSEDKDILLGGLDKVGNIIENEGSVIVSTHPHRWHSNEVTAKAKDLIFRTIKFTAKCMLNIPLMKKFMGRFYYLAKKL